MGETNIGALSTGLLKISVSAGVATPTTATPGTDYPQVKGTTSSSSGPVTVTSANNRMTYVATAAVHYDLPTGDLSAFVATGIDPLQYTFVKTAAGTLTIDPGTDNFIGNGAASATMADSTAGETYATLTIRLISSATSVNTWAIISGFGTWTPSA